MEFNPNAHKQVNDEDALLKQIDEINFQHFANVVAEAISEQIGGRFTANLQKFEKQAAKNLQQKFTVTLELTDHQVMGRNRAASERGLR